MKRYKFLIILVAIIVVNGCGVSDIKIDSAENLTIEDNTSSENSTISDNTQVDDTPIVINDQHNSDQTTTTQTVADQTTINQTTNSDNTSINIVIDPNACSSTYETIEDDYNLPEGTHKDGIIFASYTNPPSTTLIFYYTPENLDNPDNLNYIGNFKSADGSTIFSLSINEKYYGKGYFYAKNSSNNKCYRGEFPNQFSPPKSEIIEVVQK